VAGRQAGVQAWCSPSSKLRAALLHCCTAAICPLHPEPSTTTDYGAASDTLGTCQSADPPQARKEFGKTKLYIPSQEGLAALGPAEAAQRLEDIKRLQAECQGADGEVAGLRKGECCAVRWVGRGQCSAVCELLGAGCWRHSAPT
jgi:hypothetical protein